MFAARLHGCQQGGLRVKRLGHGLFLRQPVSHDHNFLSFGKYCASLIALRLVLVPVLFPAEHAAPAGTDNDGRSGTEIHPLAGTFHDQRLFLAGRGKGFQHPAGYQGIDGRFRLGQFLWCDTRDDQGVVVGHFRIVHAPRIQTGKIKSVPIFLEIGHSHDFLQQ